MNNTLKLITDIKKAIKNGQLNIEDLPIDDLKSCVLLEIETAKMSYTEDQFIDVIDHFNSFISLFERASLDKKQAEAFLGGLLLSIDTISNSVLSLANGSYWRQRYADKIDDPEISGIISFIDSHRKLQLISYNYIDEYVALPCQSGFDADCGMVYVMHKGRRMYFPKYFDETSAIEYYRTICGEQDPRSPHCYNANGFSVEAGDIVVDCGGAEGFFSLDHLDEASEIYIFDADNAWIESLEKTFENYRDKVHIFYGFVGSNSDNNSIALDDVFRDKTVNYIKMDIEGAERNALIGAKELIHNSPALKLAICAYHLEDDEAWITGYFEKLKLEHTTSKGYMIPDWCCNTIIETPLRRGVVFGRK